MSRRTWQAPSLAVGVRVHSDPVPVPDEGHPGPTLTERAGLAAADAVRRRFPALARAFPERVEAVQLDVEAVLEGRNPRERRGRRRR